MVPVWITAQHMTSPRWPEIDSTLDFKIESFPCKTQCPVSTQAATVNVRAGTGWDEESCSPPGPALCWGLSSRGRQPWLQIQAALCVSVSNSKLSASVTSSGREMRIATDLKFLGWGGTQGGDTL